MAAKLTKHRCGLCGRRLRESEYVFSRFTGARYCFPGKCRTNRAQHDSTEARQKETA